MYHKAFGKENIYLRTTFIKRISEDELGCEDLSTQERGSSSSSSSSNLLAYTLHTFPYHIYLTVIYNNRGYTWDRFFILVTMYRLCVLGLDHWSVWSFVSRPTNHHLHHHKKRIRLHDGQFRGVPDGIPVVWGPIRQLQ